jgi:hypothetical protein
MPARFLAMYDSLSSWAAIVFPVGNVAKISTTTREIPWSETGSICDIASDGSLTQAMSLAIPADFGRMSSSKFRIMCRNVLRCIPNFCAALT